MACLVAGGAPLLSAAPTDRPSPPAGLRRNSFPLGAKLAAPERFVVVTIGDGGFIFANPTACHSVAAVHGLPILIVIFNTAGYAAVRNATLATYASGAVGRDNGLLLADLSPSPPFEKIAKDRERVERPEDLRAAMAAAREAVLRQRRHALLNVITPY